MRSTWITVVTRYDFRVQVLYKWSQKGVRTVIGKNWLGDLGIQLKTEGKGKAESNLIQEPKNKQLFTKFGGPFFENKKGRGVRDQRRIKWKRNPLTTPGSVKNAQITRTSRK